VSNLEKRGDRYHGMIMSGIYLILIETFENEEHVEEMRHGQKASLAPIILNLHMNRQS